MRGANMRWEGGRFHISAPLLEVKCAFGRHFDTATYAHIGGILPPVIPQSRVTFPTHRFIEFGIVP